MDKFKLESYEAKKWVRNLLIFLRPLILLYIGTIGGIIALHGGEFHLVDLIPTPFTWGTIILYLSNAATDYLKKLTII